MAEPALVFVYGALMRGCELHHHMDGGELVAEGSVAGALVSLGRYPGLIEGSGRVRGEVYRFDDLPAALDVLDDVEEFDPTDPAGSLYVRVPMRVATGAGEIDAWTYRYNGATDGAPRITSGDWRAK